MVRIRSLVLAASIALAPTAQAGPTGNEWKAICDESDVSSRRLCLGIVSGVVQGLGEGFVSRDKIHLEMDSEANLGRQLTKAEKDALPVENFFCPPDGVTQGQIRDLVYKSVTADPASRQLPLSMLAMSALLETWPCDGQPIK